jgi:hypothetical protein
MILEILAAYALLQCATAFARLIGHRHDVLHYVAKTNPRW